MGQGRIIHSNSYRSDVANDRATRGFGAVQKGSPLMMFAVGRCYSQVFVFCIRYTFTFDRNMPVVYTPVYLKGFNHEKKPSMVGSDCYRE